MVYFAVQSTWLSLKSKVPVFCTELPRIRKFNP